MFALDQGAAAGGALANLMLYEARFFDHRDEIFSSQIFGAESDEAARDYANRVLKTRFSRGHEIWHGQRLVHREIYQP